MIEELSEPELDPPAGGPPMFTDDTGTPGAGHVELNVITVGEFSGTHLRLEAPLWDINYGASERIQLKLEIPYVFQTSNDTKTVSALGNSVVGIKYRFYEDQQSGLSLAVYPQIAMNTNRAALDRNIEERGYEALLPFIFTQNLGRFSIGGEVGAVLREHERDGILYGATGGYNVSNRIQLLAELYGQTLKDISDHELILHLGSRVTLDKDKRFKLLVSFGHTVVGESGYVAQIGLQYVY